MSGLKMNTRGLEPKTTNQKSRSRFVHQKQTNVKTPGENPIANFSRNENIANFSRNINPAFVHLSQDFISEESREEISYEVTNNRESEIQKSGSSG